MDLTAAGRNLWTLYGTQLYGLPGYGCYHCCCTDTVYLPLDWLTAPHCPMVLLYASLQHRVPVPTVQTRRCQRRSDYLAPTLYDLDGFVLVLR